MKNTFLLFLMISIAFCSCKHEKTIDSKEEVFLREVEINLMFQLIFCEDGYAILEVVSSSEPQTIEEYAFKTSDLPASITSQNEWQSKPYIGTLKITGKNLTCELYAKPQPGESVNQPTQDFPLVEIVEIRENQ